MFTIKYRFYEPAAAPSDCTAPGFTPIEQISGPYGNVSSRWESGNLVVHADNGPESPGMCFGPIVDGGVTPEQTAEYEAQCGLAGQGRAPMPAPLKVNYPRPTLWVMNASGATVAKYDL